MINNRDQIDSDLLVPLQQREHVLIKLTGYLASLTQQIHERNNQIKKLNEQVDNLEKQIQTKKKQVKQEIKDKQIISANIKSQEKRWKKQNQKQKGKKGKQLSSLI